MKGNGRPKGCFGESVVFSAPLRFALKTLESLRIATETTSHKSAKWEISGSALGSAPKGALGNRSAPGGEHPEFPIAPSGAPPRALGFPRALLGALAKALLEISRLALL